jgi:hypothetical protein
MADMWWRDGSHFRVTLCIYNYSEIHKTLKIKQRCEETYKFTTKMYPNVLTDLNTLQSIILENFS